jgi:hypothetical protein
MLRQHGNHDSPKTPVTVACNQRIGRTMSSDVRLSRILHSTIPLSSTVTLVTLVALVWGGLASCDEIYDAAKSGGLASAKHCCKALRTALAKHSKSFSLINCVSVGDGSDAAKFRN